MKPQFIVIGIGDSRTPRFTAEQAEWIAASKVFSGGVRHHAIVGDMLPAGHTWIDIGAPVADATAAYRRHFAAGCTTIVVFASGDPLFFGFANTLMREMPEAGLRLFPSFNSLQMLAHRIPMRYDDMRIVSLTGRPWHEFDRALIERAPKIGVLTDRTRTPAAIARRMAAYGYGAYTVYVGEHLGNAASERISRLTVDEAAEAAFDSPNCMIVCCADAGPRPFGIADSRFDHLDGRSRMITKMPVRLLTLQAMELPARHTMWDIGFCTGSISIEARLLFPHVRVVAFEVRPEGARLIDTNSRRFGAPGIEALTGDFLAADTAALPRPDAVFIGGHGGRLHAIMAKAAEALLPGGCIVLNSVSDSSRDMFVSAAGSCGLTLCPPQRIALDDYNPITIMKAIKATSRQ